MVAAFLGFPASILSTPNVRKIGLRRGPVHRIGDKLP